MEPRSLEEKIHKVLDKQLKKRGLKFNLRASESIIAAGLLDSLSAIELVAELESIFKIEIAPEEMNESNFDSLSNIVQFIGVKLSKR